MKIVLTGATGFVGSEVLAQSLADPSIDRVVVLVRRPLGATHPKVKEIILADFLDYSTVTESLKADACIWCLGVSQFEVSEEDYIKVTVDYVMAAARAMLAINPNIRFCFLSGRAADHDERSRTLYGRIKGRAERQLSQLSPTVFHFRPAFLRPSHPGQKRPLVARLFVPIASVADRFTDSFSVDVATLARCLIGVARSGAVRQIFDNSAIRHYQTQSAAHGRKARSI